MSDTEMVGKIFQMLQDLKDSVDAFNREIHGRVCKLEQDTEAHVRPCVEMKRHLTEHEEKDRRRQDLWAKFWGTILAFLAMAAIGAIIYAFDHGYSKQLAPTNMVNSPLKQ